MTLVTRRTALSTLVGSHIFCASPKYLHAQSIDVTGVPGVDSDVDYTSMRGIRFGPEKRFRLAYSQNGQRCHGVIEQTAGKPKLYALPQSDAEKYKRLRPDDLKYFSPPPTARSYECEELIGPHQVEGDRLWLGNNYYHGEGRLGVGAFGYFDTISRSYTLFSPPEVARWQISAMLVEPTIVWLGLDNFGEDISTAPGGIVRWNRNDHQVEHLDLEFVVKNIARDGNDPASLKLTTGDGFALLRNSKVKRFRTRKLSNGSVRSIAIDKFPPGPSIH